VTDVDGALLQERNHRERAAEGHESRLQALPEDRRCQRHRHGAGQEDERRGPQGERVRPPRPAPGIGPQLVDEAAPDQDDDEARVEAEREPEAGGRDQCQRHVGDEVAAEPDEGAGDDRADSGGEAVEELVELALEARLDVGDRERQHQQEAGQHETEAG
jgi:hypothetical protein